MNSEQYQQRTIWNPILHSIHLIYYVHKFAHSHAVNNFPTLVTHSDPPVRPRLPTIARPEERNSGPPHCLQQRAGHTVEGGVLSRTRSARLTYHIREPRPSVIRERPHRRPCASASGIAIEIPLRVPNREVWRRTPCERSWEPRYRRCM